MTEAQIRDVVLSALGRIAPEADLSALAPDVSFRDQLDIDSMDFLNFVVDVCEQLHVEIPEADYRKLASLEECVAYLQSRQSRHEGGSLSPVNRGRASAAGVSRTPAEA
jgi:acyl carrier protein